MKKPGILVSCVVLVALLGPGALGSRVEDAKPAGSEKEKKIRRLLEVSNAGNMGKQVLDQMLEAFRQQPLPPGFIEKFKELAKPSELVDLCVPVYLKHLDEADVDAAITFYESPVGKRIVEKQALIVKECMLLGQKWGQETALKALQSLDKGKGKGASEEDK